MRSSLVMLCLIGGLITSAVAQEKETISSLEKKIWYEDDDVKRGELIKQLDVLKAKNRETKTPSVYYKGSWLPQIQSEPQNEISPEEEKMRRAKVKALLESLCESKNSDPEFWIQLQKKVAEIGPLWDRSEKHKLDSVFLNEFYDIAATHAGENDEFNESAASYYFATGQVEKAEKIYLVLIKRKPDKLGFRKKLASVYKDKGDSKSYLSTLLELAEISPDDAITHRKIAQAYQSQGDIQNYVKHEKIALKIGKGSKKDYLRVAQAMAQEDIHEEAVTFTKQAADIFPQSPEFPLLLTFTLRRVERYEEAAKYYEIGEKIAEKVRPDLLDTHFYFGFASSVERAGDIGKAAKLFRKTIELIGKQNPEKEDRVFTAQVYNYLGYMWLENDMNIDEAGELIKIAADLDPESAAISDSLGWFFFKKGRFEEASKELLRSETLLEEEGSDPDDVILDHIAKSFYALKNIPKAIEYAEKALKLAPKNEEYSKRLESYRKDE